MLVDFCFWTHRESQTRNEDFNEQILETISFLLSKTLPKIAVPGHQVSRSCVAHKVVFKRSQGSWVFKLFFFENKKKTTVLLFRVNCVLLPAKQKWQRWNICLLSDIKGAFSSGFCFQVLGKCFRTFVELEHHLRKMNKEKAKVHVRCQSLRFFSFFFLWGTIVSEPASQQKLLSSFVWWTQCLFPFQQNYFSPVSLLGNWNKAGVRRYIWECDFWEWFPFKGEVGLYVWINLWIASGFASGCFIHSRQLPAGSNYTLEHSRLMFLQRKWNNINWRTVFSFPVEKEGATMFLNIFQYLPLVENRL